MDIVTSCTKQRTYQQLLNIWQHCLTGDLFTDPHEGVVDELSRFFGLPPEKVRWIWSSAAFPYKEDVIKDRTWHSR